MNYCKFILGASLIISMSADCASALAKNIDADNLVSYLRRAVKDGNLVIEETYIRNEGMGLDKYAQRKTWNGDTVFNQKTCTTSNIC